MTMRRWLPAFRLQRRWIAWAVSALAAGVLPSQLEAQPTPTGACCANLGCFEDETVEGCEARPGTFLGNDTTCQSEIAACPTGACCADGFCIFDAGLDGHIFYQNQRGCEDFRGGTYLGDGATCTEGSCTDACCVGGVCEDLPSSECITRGGNPLGDGTTCATANPTCLGACCANLGCFEGETVEGCQARPGAFLGNDTTCQSEIAACPTGACCADGFCIFDAGLDGHIFYQNQRGCEDFRGGTYLGDGSTCDTNTTCRGACCSFPFGSCRDGTDQETCENELGTYLGNDTTCAGAENTTCPIGACCVLGACSDVDSQGYFTESYCGAAGGDYLGDGVTCAEANTTCHGACCDFFGACADDQDQGICESSGGTYLGNDTTCAGAANTTCPIGACCGLGTCLDVLSPVYFVTESYCNNTLGGSYLGDGVTCEEANTTCRGACCDLFGACADDQDEGICESSGGTYLGNDTTCAGAENTTCPIGACCLFGTCLDILSPVYFVTESYCNNELAGIYLGDGETCIGADCTIGACTTCCECSHLNENDCAAAGGEFHGMRTPCGQVPFTPDTTPPQITCPTETVLSRGDRFCGEEFSNWLATATVNDNCDLAAELNHDFPCGIPFGTSEVTFTATDDCGNTASCSVDVTVGPAPRVDGSKKGSLLVFPKVELRWAAGLNGVLLQDTVLELTNDYPEEVCVQLYFVQGDEPLDPIFAGDPPLLISEGEPGWNWADCQFCLTPDQSTYWSAATGLPAGCQPFTVLDPSTGIGPGRPDPEVPGERMLRGLVYAWAVDAQGREISWNHLSGGATLLHFANADAWEYSAYAFQSPCSERGAQPLDCLLFDENGVCCEAEVRPGQLGMDGLQYDLGYDALLLKFMASGSTALSGGIRTVASDTDLTLHPITADLRQDGVGPVTTKAEFAIWNENERRFSGTTRCITCWDQTLLSRYASPNHFLRDHLQTDGGKARIDGVRSDVCDLNCIREVNGNSLEPDFALDLLGLDHVCSFDAALLGVAAKHLAFSGAGFGRATAGGNLVGMGTQRGWIKNDIIALPGTLLGKGTMKPGLAAPNRTIGRGRPLPQSR